MTIAPERPIERAMSNSPRPKFQDELRLAALLTAVSCSRLFVRYDLQSWGVAHEPIEMAELLVSELVAHAVKMTGIIEPQPRYSEAYDRLKLIGIRLRLFARSIVIEVWDSSTEPPILKQSSLDAESGCGLFLVQSRSRAWNYYLPKSGGKVVWCELNISDPRLDDTTKLPPALPRRRRQATEVRPTKVMDDPDILRRVLDGLRTLGEDEQER